MVQVQFVDEKGGTWPLVEMSNVPRVNESIVMPDEKRQDAPYLVKMVVWQPLDSSVVIRVVSLEKGP